MTPYRDTVASGEENMALVRQFYNQVVNDRDRALLSKAVHAKFLDHIPQLVPGQPTEGHEAVQWFLDTMCTAVPDLHVEIDDLIASGDRVVARVTWQGTQRGQLFGASPTGKRVRFTGIDIIRITDGKIAEHWGQVDVFAVIGQLGFMPS